MSLFRYVMLAILGMLGVLLYVQFPTTAAPDRPAQPIQQALAKINLNTAPEHELRELPRVSAGSVKAIVYARAKSNFKNWNDFVARRVVPNFTERAIKGVVTF